MVAVLRGDGGGAAWRWRRCCVAMVAVLRGDLVAVLRGDRGGAAWRWWLRGDGGGAWRRWWCVAAVVRGDGGGVVVDYYCFSPKLVPTSNQYLVYSCMKYTSRGLKGFIINK